MMMIVMMIMMVLLMMIMIINDDHDDDCCKASYHRAVQRVQCNEWSLWAFIPMQWQWQCVHCVQCVHNVHILQCSGKMQLEESALGCKCIPSYCPLFLIIPLQFIQRFKTNSNFHWDLQWVLKTMINICLWYTYDAHRPSLQWRGTRLQSFVKCNLLNTFLKMDDGVTNLCCFGVIRYH